MTVLIRECDLQTKILIWMHEVESAKKVKQNYLLN